MKILTNKKYFIYQITIIILLLIVAFLIGRLFIFKNEFYAKVNKYPYIDFSRNFISQEYYLTNLESLRKSLREFIATYQAKKIDISIYFEYLNTGGNISINNDLHLIPASLNKIPVAIAVMKKVEQGEWKLTDRLVLLPEDRDDNYGVLYTEPTGKDFSIDFLLQQSLQQSDNTALNILLRNVTIEGVTAILDEIGLQELFNERGLITTKEYSRLFRSLYTASLLNRENSQYLLSLLTQTDFNEFITKNIPENIAVAHKFGMNQEYLVFADSGIIYIPYKPYLLTVMVNPNNSITKEIALMESGKIISDISKIIFDYINEH